MEEIRSKLETGVSHTRSGVPGPARQHHRRTAGAPALHRWAGEDWTRAKTWCRCAAAVHIPHGTPLLSQLQRFQESRQRLGLVVDEYGELLGLITLDDILEEIVAIHDDAREATSSSAIRRQRGGRRQHAAAPR